MNIGTACCHSASCSDTSCPGRPDPEHTRRTQEAEYLWTRNLDQCARSGQVDSRQIASHIAAGELDGIGNECALPIIVDDIKPATNWSAFARWGAAVALCVLWAVLVILR
jgi:hypothetical protein